MNMFLNLLAFGVLAWTLIQAYSTSLSEDVAIKTWTEQSPKKTNLFTILAGNCQLHENAIQDVYWDFPIYRFDSNVSTIKDLVSHFRGSCKLHQTCPSQVVLIRNAHQLRSFDLVQIFETFLQRRMCFTAEYGGLDKVDCSRIWFVLSTCLPADLCAAVDVSQLEGEDEHEADVEAKTWRELRALWPQVTLPHASMRIIQNDRQNSSSFEALAKNALDQISLNRGQDEFTKSKKPPGNVKNNIDLAVFDRLGFTGQEWARRAVESTLQAVQRGLKLSTSPITFLFLGPAGVGKTFLASATASAYNGGMSLSDMETSLLFKVFAMGDYQTADEVDSFVSPPVGRVGKGSMVEVFEKTLRPVIVLDEIEKADPKLFSNLLLPWLNEDGAVSDKKNVSAKFPTRDAIFILTSNCFSDVVSASSRMNQRNAQKVSEDVLGVLQNSSYKMDLGCSVLRQDFVRRRLQKGHELSGLEKFGFVVFMPPSPQDAEKSVLSLLNAYQRKMNLFWTENALFLLKDAALKALSQSKGSGGLSYVNSVVSSAINKVLMEDSCEDRTPKTRTLLYRRNRQLHAYSVDCGSFATSTVPDKKLESFEKEPKLDELNLDRVASETTMHRTPSRGKLEDLELEKEVEPAREKQNEISQWTWNEWFRNFDRENDTNYWWHQLKLFVSMLATLFVVAQMPQLVLAATIQVAASAALALAIFWWYFPETFWFVAYTIQMLFRLAWFIVTTIYRIGGVSTLVAIFLLFLADLCFPWLIRPIMNRIRATLVASFLRANQLLHRKARHE